MRERKLLSLASLDPVCSALSIAVRHVGKKRKFGVLRDKYGGWLPVRRRTADVQMKTLALLSNAAGFRRIERYFRCGRTVESCILSVGGQGVQETIDTGPG